MKPLVLLPPSRNKSMKLYIAASRLTIGSMLPQEDENGIERAIYYLRRILIDAGTRYNAIEIIMYVLILLMYQTQELYKTWGSLHLSSS